MRRRLLSTACCLALFPAAALHAQDADEPARDDAERLDAIEVTGIRHAIATSVETKSESNSIVEAVSAEDIGKLPDLSIAESIARLPGLAAQRVDGRAQVIAIRGLSPDFAATLLNGREQVSTGDNRGVEFDQYPSELMHGVTVYKTPDAHLIGQGLSGTINLQTVRPLDIGQRKIVLNARGESNSLGEQNDGRGDTGYRLSASYIDQFADDTFGVALGYAHLDSPFQEQHYKAWWWFDTAQWGAPIPGQPAGAIALQGAEVWARSRDQQRDGLMGVFEYKPSDELHSTLDVYYSAFDQAETMRGIMWPQDPWTGNGVNYSGTTTTPVGGDTLLTGATANNLRPIVRNDINDRKDHLLSAGWNTAWEMNDDWSMNFDLSYSRAKRKQSVLETYAGSAGLDSIVEQIPVDPAFPTFSTGLDYADPSLILLSDPAHWGHDGRLELPRQKDTIKGYRLEFSRAFVDGPVSSIDFGFNRTDREKDKTSTVFFANLLNGRAPISVGSDLIVPSTDLGFAGIPGVLSYDVLGVLDRYYGLDLELSQDDLKKDFTVSEKVDTGYFQLNFDTEVSDSVTLRGNVGFQYIHSDQSSSAFNIDRASGQVLGAIERGTDYNDFLPSLNLVADFGDGYLLRFGAAKTLARQRIDDLRASASAGVSTTTRLWSGSGGNPELEPWRAKSYDLSAEKYFGDASYVALALFHKKLDTYVYTQTVDFDFTGFVNNSEVEPLSNIGSFSTPANGEGGWMRGAEVSTALEGSLLSDRLSGFGLLVNGSYTESSIKPSGPNTAETATLPGLSRVVANGTLYYENAGFSARVSQRYRSSFRGEITSLFAQRSFTRVLPDRQTDLQLSYEFPDSSRWAGVTLLLQANNITNSPYRTVQDSNFPGGAVAPLEYNEYGRQYLFGVNYSF